MKNTLYFKTEEEKNQYFPDGVPSNILAVVGEEGVLYTSSNNRTMTGVSENQGGYNTSPDDEARITYLEENKADKSELVGLATEAYVTSAISGVSVDMTGYATEAYVTSKIQDVVGAAPAALDTLNELAVALNNDENFASYVANELAKKANSTDVPSLEGYATEAYVATYVSTYAPTPDMSAYVSKTELEGMSYATESYVSSNYWKQPYGITIIDNNEIRFGHNASEYETAYARILPTSWGLRILSDSSSKKIQLGYVGKNGIVEIGNNVTFKYDNVYLNGVGNFDGTNQANAYTLAYVINELQNNQGGGSVPENVITYNSTIKEVSALGYDPNAAPEGNNGRYIPEGGLNIIADTFENVNNQLVSDGKRIDGFGVQTQENEWQFTRYQVDNREGTYIGRLYDVNIYQEIDEGTGDPQVVVGEAIPYLKAGEGLPYYYEFKGVTENLTQEDGGTWEGEFPEDGLPLLNMNNAKNSEYGPVDLQGEGAQNIKGIAVGDLYEDNTTHILYYDEADSTVNNYPDNPWVLQDFYLESDAESGDELITPTSKQHIATCEWVEDLIGDINTVLEQILGEEPSE